MAGGGVILVSTLEAGSTFARPLFSAFRASYFLLLRQKKGKQRKGDPGAVPAAPVPCATRNAGRLAKLAFRPDNPSRRPPAFLRCSAPSKGPGKPAALMVG